MKLWERPDHYAGENWYDYFTGLGQNRDSDVLTRCNFIESLERLGGESDTVIVVRERHWAVGWVEWIAIHKSDTQAVEIQKEIENDLELYPVLNDDSYSEMEGKEADEVWKNCYNDEDRLEYIRKNREQFYFNDWGEIRQVVKGEYFTGYACELIY
jgi:hypothetical protein